MCFNILLLRSRFVCPSLRRSCDFLSGPLGRKCSLCDIRILPLPAFFFFLLRKPCLAGMLFHPDLSAAVPMGSTKPSLWSHQRESAHVCKYGVWLLKPARACPSNVPTLNIYQKWLFSGNRHRWAPSLQPPPCHWVWGFLYICRHPTVSQLQINAGCLRWSRRCFYLYSLIFAALAFTNYRAQVPEG